MKRVDLLIPGLFGPIAIPSDDLTGFPPLERLLGRADRLSVSGADPVAALFERFAIATDPDKDPPSAPFSRLGDGADTDLTAFWMHADPVHLRPDRDRLMLFDSRNLGITHEEADALVELFNGHFGADGLWLEAPDPGRWYLQVEEPPRIRTHSLSAAVGRSIDRLLPKGPEAARWIAWLNEVQMLFHDSEVNRRREQAGRPMINGIWPWGGGQLPESVPGAQLDAVYAEHPLAIGLARAAKVPVRPLTEDAQELVGSRSQATVLLFWDRLWPAVLDADFSTWVQELERLQTLLARLERELRRGRLEALDILPCNGTGFHATRRSLRRFWRRRLALGAQLQVRDTD
ncbi:MAG: phosphoglycerate mutase [Pseudomonadota bacterium]|nr:phosphoglycerate mutase [Pseudomonadota bacterium]